MLRGGFPEALARKGPARRSEWFRSYLTTVTEREAVKLAISYAGGRNVRRKPKLFGGKPAGDCLILGAGVLRRGQRFAGDDAGRLAAEAHRRVPGKFLGDRAADHGRDAGHRADEILDHAVRVGVVDVETVELAVGREVDAGLGLPSHACQVMEWGYDAVLLNTAVALAQEPVTMAGAFADAVQAGRSAFLAGAMTAQDAAQPSTPVLGTPFWHQP